MGFYWLHILNGTQWLHPYLALQQAPAYFPKAYWTSQLQESAQAVSAVAHTEKGDRRPKSKSNSHRSDST